MLSLGDGSLGASRPWNEGRREGGRRANKEQMTKLECLARDQNQNIGAKKRLPDTHTAHSSALLDVFFLYFILVLV